MENIFAIRLEHGFQLGKDLGRCPHHGVEFARFGLDRRAGQGRVHQGHACSLAACCQTAGGVGLAGGRIHHDQASAGLAEQTLRPFQCGLDLRGAGHANDDRITSGQFRMRPHELGARGQQILQRLAPGMRGQGDLKAFGQQIFGDAMAHEARGTNKTNVFHAILSCDE